MFRGRAIKTGVLSSPMPSWIPLSRTTFWHSHSTYYSPCFLRAILLLHQKIEDLSDHFFSRFVSCLDVFSSDSIVMSCFTFSEATYGSLYFILCELWYFHPSRLRCSFLSRCSLLFPYFKVLERCRKCSTLKKKWVSKRHTQAASVQAPTRNSLTPKCDDGVLLRLPQQVSHRTRWLRRLRHHSNGVLIRLPQQRLPQQIFQIASPLLRRLCHRANSVLLRLQHRQLLLRAPTLSKTQSFSASVRWLQLRRHAWFFFRIQRGALQTCSLHRSCECVIVALYALCCFQVSSWRCTFLWDFFLWCCNRNFCAFITNVAITHLRSLLMWIMSFALASLLQ